MQKKRDRIIEWFNNYTESFCIDSEELKKNISLKKEHSLRVRSEIVYLSESLGMTEDDKVLAEIIAVLHDIGRFEQFCKYKTFADKHSVNHAELGIKILQNNRLLSDFNSESENIVLKSILYHNRPFLPENEDPEILFFSKLLRDADKLDIWEVVLEYYSAENILKNKAIGLGLPETDGISSEVYKAIMHHSIVNMIYVRNLNDFKILQAGWIFDINFKPSIYRIIDRKYLSRLESSLPDNISIKTIFNEVNNYLDKVKNSTSSQINI